MTEEQQIQEAERSGKVLMFAGFGSLGCSGFAVVAAFGLFLLLFAVGSSLNTTPASGSTTSTQSASNLIPDVLKPIFQKAADKHNMSVDFLAAIFWKEHGKSFPTSGPWATSPAGANGPFQFLLSTWTAHKEDCNGDGVADVQNISDASCGAADLLSGIGARGVFDASSQSLAKLRDAASKYNSGQPWSIGQTYAETADYVPDVIDEYQRLLQHG